MLLIEKINFNALIGKSYLAYQFYSNENNRLFYDNIYFNELMKPFPKGGKKEIILITKNEWIKHQFMDFLKSYMKQKEITANFYMMNFRRKLLKNYKESHTLLFDGEHVMIFVK